MPADITSPDLAYGPIAPLLVVFAAALIGVLIEAFAPRGARRGLQIAVAVAGLVGALAATILLAGTEELVFADAIAVDGPALFLQGTLALLGLLSVLLISERSLDSSGGAVVARAAVLPGSREDAALAEATEVQTEIYPLAMFSLGGMMLFPASNNLLLMFVALEVLSLPLYLMAGLARRRRLLSQEAAVKYFLLGAFASAFFLYGVALLYGYAGSVDLGEVLQATTTAGSNEGLLFLGLAMLAVGLLFKVGAVPFQAWTPDVYQGAPTPVTALMAACTKISAFGALLRVFYVGFGPAQWDWRPMLWAVAIITMVVGGVLAVTQTDVKRMLAYSSVAHTGFLLVGVVAISPQGPVRDAVLPAGLRVHDHRRLRRRHARARQRRGGDPPGAVDRTGQAQPARRGHVRVPAAGAGGHPAHERLHGQVRGVHRRRRGRGDGARHRRCRHQRRDGVLLRPGDRAHVLQRARRRRPDRRRPQRLHRRRDRGRAGGDGGARRRAPAGARARGRRVAVRLLVEVPAGFDAADPALAQDVKNGLEDVEARLREVVLSAHPMLTETATHLAEAGGKRFRPLLALLAAQLGDPAAPGVLDAAVVVELTHLASLYHDDVMDEAEVRRGAPSANTRWTNTVAILTGDYLFARASDLTAGLGTEATHLQSRTFARLVEGQIAETAGPAEGQDAVEHHLQVLADKTGALIATSARLGALMAGAPAAAVDTVTRFGEVIGLAFQLSDDLIDVRSETGESGKTPGTDLREGIRTLPVLLVLASSDQSPDSNRLRSLLAGDLDDDERLAEALQLLRAHPAMDEAAAHLHRCVEQARAIVAELAPGPARDALAALPSFVLARSG